MVWIHGGADTTGSSWAGGFYDQEPIALHGNVVAVSLNYRLGPLGELLEIRNAFVATLTGKKKMVLKIFCKIITSPSL